MADVLEAHLLRLGRAYHHLEALADVMQTFVDENRDRTAEEFEFDDGSWWYVGYTVEWPDPSPEWGLLLGEAMHQFRSTLDNLVWTLVKTNNAKPSNTCAFPICSSETDWNKRVVHTRRSRDIDPPLKGIADEAFEAIHDRQPYKRGHDAKRHPLTKLNWLNNVDKHQVAHVSTLTSPEKSPVIYYRTNEGRRHLLREYRITPGKTLHGEAKVEAFRVRLPRTFDRDLDTQNVEVDDFFIEVALSPRRYILTDLREIASEVTHILRDFGKQFFPTSHAIAYLDEVIAAQQKFDL